MIRSGTGSLGHTLSDLEELAVRLCLATFGISEYRNSYQRASLALSTFTRLIGIDVGLRLRQPVRLTRTQAARAKRVGAALGVTKDERLLMQHAFAEIELVKAFQDVVDRQPLGSALVSAAEIAAMERRADVLGTQANALWDAYHNALHGLAAGWERDRTLLWGTEPLSLGDRITTDWMEGFLASWSKGRGRPVPPSLPTYRLDSSRAATLFGLLQIAARLESAVHPLDGGGIDYRGVGLPDRIDVRDWADLSRVVQHQVVPAIQVWGKLTEGQRRSDAREIAFYQFRVGETCVENVVPAAYVTMVANAFRHPSGK